jgi:DNA-binding response OmpR family regulator
MAKIMIVDDEPDLREMIDLMMKKAGFETQTAFNGEDFLNKIEIFNPDLVTLDVMMPGLTTKEILEKLNLRNLHPKIILLTVIRFSESEKETVKKMGNVVDYMTKPFEFKELIEQINYHINH